MKTVGKLATLAIAIFLFAGCSDKQPESNKPALYWYQQIVASINRFDLDSAGDYYSSLKSEHFRSPLIPEATLIMAINHMENEEYLLANFYLDEYIKRFGNSDNIEFIRFLKLKANYMAFSVPNRDQKLLLDTIDRAKDYTSTMKSSVFIYHADSILGTLKVANANMNQEIAKLYKKKEKEKAYQLYNQRSEMIDDESIEIEDPDVFWLRALFE